MKKMKLYETFTNESSVNLIDNDSLCESSTGSKLPIDGKYIIGMIEGQFFQPDGMSRNGRWYSRSLWENVLKSADVQNRLMNHTMFGEIGHSDGPVTDMTLRNGDASHIVTDLWIDAKGRGMGRAYILNTETGRNLKTYLGATSKLKVSTRGEGVYLEGKFHDGKPVIDPASYELQTVDFVLCPGFLETSAHLTESKEVNESAQKTQKVNETIAHANKEGEKRMGLDMDAYVAELKEELKSAKAEVKSLSEQLNTKEKELLEKQFVESAEIKKINEEFAPFKKMNVSAKTLSETLKRSQEALKSARIENKKMMEENEKLSKELQAFKDTCGSIEQIQEATELSAKALNTVSEYQKLGTVEQLKDLYAKAEALAPKLQELSQLTEYKKLGSIEDLKLLSERCEESLEKLAELPMLEDYKQIGTVEDIKGLAVKCKNLLPQLEELKESRRLKANVEKILPRLQENKQLREYAKKANSIIEQYLNTVGSIKKAQELVESRKETIKKVNVREAVELARKFGCTVEEAAKTLKAHGTEAASMLESKQKETEASKAQLTESKQLVEEAAQLDKVGNLPEEKSAHDFVKTGMITNQFNKLALGREIKLDDLTKLNGEKVDGANAAKNLLQAYKDKVEVEAAPKVEEPKSAEDAEKEADKLLK